MLTLYRHSDFLYIMPIALMAPGSKCRSEATFNIILENGVVGRLPAPILLILKDVLCNYQKNY